MRLVCVLYVCPDPPCRLSWPAGSVGLPGKAVGFLSHQSTAYLPDTYLPTLELPRPWGFTSPSMYLTHLPIFPRSARYVLYKIGRSQSYAYYPMSQERVPVSQSVSRQPRTCSLLFKKTLKDGPSCHVVRTQPFIRQPRGGGKKTFQITYTASL